VSDLQCAARLFVARHGAPEYESDLLVDQGGSLTLEGRSQSRALGDRLAGERVACVYTSPYSRATQTAELAAARLGGLGVTVREALIEVSVGAFAGDPSEPDPIRPVFARWAEGDLDARIAGAESGREVIARLEGVLDDIADRHRGEAVLVVSHGGVMSAALPALAANLTMAHVMGRHLPNAGVVAVERDADGWVVRSWPGVDLP
jgi:probable phosphoglycerate mutase